jgi:hypothetical protein
MRRPLNPAVAILLIAAVAVPFGVARADDEPTIDGKPLSVWLKRIRGSNRGLQVRAARALAEAPEEARPKIVKALIPVLKSDRQNDRFVAAQVLGECGALAREAVPNLLPMLEGTQFERNRAAAAKALGQILEDAKPSEEIEKVTQKLISVFKDRYPDVRREAVRACGMIGPAAKSCVDHLPSRCDDSGVSCFGVRSAAAWTMGRMGRHAEKHIDKLISVLHRDGQRLPTIVQAIGRIGPVHENVLPNIIDVMEEGAKSSWNNGKPMGHWPFGKAAMGALREFGPKAAPALPFLMRLLPKKSGSSKVNVRANLTVITEVTRTIGAIGPAAKEAVPQLKVMTTFRNHPHGDNTPEKLDALHKAAKEALARVEGGNAK